MWQGPATHPGYSSNIHDHWSAFWEFSGGDFAIDAVHQIDLARWMTGVDDPQSVYSVGGSYCDDGVAEVPCTQVAVFEFPKLVIVFEMTLYTPYMIKSDPLVRDTDIYPYWPQNTEP